MTASKSEMLAAPTPHEVAVQDAILALAGERKKLALVQEVGRALSSGLPLEELLAVLMAKVTELMEADRATLYVLSDDGYTLWSKLTQGPQVTEIQLRVGEGLAGWVAHSGELVNLVDAYQDERFQPAIDLRSGYRTTSVLCVPMRGATAEIVGVVQVLNKHAGPFTRADEDLLGALASQAAMAIANAKLLHSVRAQNAALSRVRRDLERKTRELNALYELEKEVSSAVDLPDLMQRVLEHTVLMMGGGAGAILRRQPKGGLRYAHATGAVARKLVGKVLAPGQGIIGWAIAHRTPVVVDNPADDPRHAVAFAKEVGLDPHVVIAVPLIYDDEVLGGMEIIEQRRFVRDSELGERARWNDDDAKILELVAARFARAISLLEQRSQAVTKERLAAIGQMLAGLLHDLKTPMTIISGYAQLMAGSDDPAQREQYVDQIRRQFDLMSGMTKEVLAFSRGDTALMVRKVYMHRLATDLEAQLGGLAEERGVRFALELKYDGVAFFDEQKILRVLHNLMRNAVEAMPNGGAVTLRVERESDQLVWSLADTGLGIPERIRDRVFELFATEKQGGTGLGLAIAKKIIDEHGGVIDYVTSNQGTTFTFRIPLTKGDGRPSSPG